MKSGQVASQPTPARGKSNFWQAGGVSTFSAVGLAAPPLYLTAEAPTGWKCPCPGQGSARSLHSWFAPARPVLEERRECAEVPLEECSNHVAAPAIAQLHLPDGHIHGAAARMKVCPGMCCQWLSVRKPRSFGSSAAPAAYYVQTFLNMRQR